MAIDYARNNYVKLGHFTNIVVEFAKNRAEHQNNGPVHMCTFMSPLISKLALTHPEWTIVAVEPVWNSTAETYKVYRFEMYEGTESIGRIYRSGWDEIDYKYEIYNGRVEAARRKSGGTKTGDMKKALKVIEKHFAPKSMEERRGQAVTDVANHTQNTSWRANRLLNDLVQRLTPALASYVVRNMNELRPELESLGAHVPSLDTLPAKYEVAKALWQVEAARHARTGITVVLLNDRYMLIPDSDPTNATIVTASQLDPSMAGKIGILKLFDKDDEAIEDVGLRVNATTFYVIN